MRSETGGVGDSVCLGFRIRMQEGFGFRVPGLGFGVCVFVSSSMRLRKLTCREFSREVWQEPLLSVCEGDVSKTLQPVLWDAERPD